MVSLLELNDQIQEGRDNVAWTLEVLIVKLKRMLKEGILHSEIENVIRGLIKHRPGYFTRYPCDNWIGDDRCENYVLCNQYQQVVNDYYSALKELRDIYRMSKFMKNEDYIYEQVEWYIENVMDKQYNWE